VRTKLRWILELQDGVAWAGLVWLKTKASEWVNMILNFPQNVEKFLNSSATWSFSRRDWLHGVGWMVS
jgi:hypothetical protein